MTETKAWEVDTCRGHFQNVSGCLFHPHQDLIISSGEDKTIRVWDLNKRTSVQSFKRDNDRFWIIAAHPQINLFAAGHDNGVMVFKLERERPASCISQNGKLYFINKEKHVRSYDFATNQESPSLVSLKKLGSPWTPPRTLSHNPAENAILITSPADGGCYELVHLPKDASGAAEPTDTRRGSGDSAVFVARNRFAVFSKSNQQVDIKDLSNSTTKTIKPPPNTTDISFAGHGTLLLVTATSVILYDIQQKKQLAELAVNGVKYVVWTNDYSHAALLSKHNINIVTRNLQQISSLHETIRIKSATWDDTGVLLYSTLNHVKYTLMNGDNGIICTQEQTTYLIKVKGWNLYCLDRTAKPKVLKIDPTEYRFKLSLVKRNYEEMLNIIKTSKLVGQSIISYVQKKGYPEIALQFVQDTQTRFELALECGNLDVAVEMAKEIDRPQLWERLGSEALMYGNHQIVEMAYQKQRSFDKLSFLYLATGDRDKMHRMTKIAEHRGDMQSLFQNTIYLGEVEKRIEMLKDADQYALAYVTAKANGFEEEAANILEAAGLTEGEVKLPKLGTPITPAKPVVATFRNNWPVKSSSTSAFERVLLGQETEEDLAASKGFGEDELETPAEGQKVGGLDVDDEEADAEGWDMGEDVDIETGDDFVNVEATEAGGAGTSEADSWARNSPIAADHVAAGSFETAMQLLNRQIGAVSFKSIQWRFEEIYTASRTFLPANPGLDPLVNYVRRTVDETNPRKVLPFIPRDLESIAAIELAGGKNAMRTNKLDDGLVNYRKILHLLMVNAVETANELDDVSLKHKYQCKSLTVVRRRSSFTALGNMFSACPLSWNAESS
jgi:coatomer protein complex subunit alpha (xenin)